jgi:DeoR family transcriptional regulator, suf operon transcriptional repressor
MNGGRVGSRPDAVTTDNRGLRRTLLLELKRAGSLTVKQLAARAGMSLNAVRHHVRELESSGLVGYERQHQGVGAPTFLYRLTAAGHALFPHRYEAVLVEILEEIVAQQGRTAAVRLLESRFHRRSHDLKAGLIGLAPSSRIGALAELLSNEGYMAEASSQLEAGTLIQHNCPIRSVAERFPEVCAAEAKFLQTVLGGEVRREQHILTGCSACEYRVQFHSPPPAEAGSSEEMV